MIPSFSSPEGVPHEGAGELRLVDLIEPDVLQRLQDSFAEATGVASIITLPDGQPLTRPSNFSRLCQTVIRPTEKGLRNCMQSDALLGRPNPGGPLMGPCLSCGLWDGGASIFVEERHVANWLIGQVRNQDLSEARILAYAREIGADENAFREAYQEVTEMPTERFRAVCDFLFLVANQLSSMAYQRVAQIRHAEEQAALEHQLQTVRRMQSIGQLAGGVAHDFNNLLTVILGNVEMLSLNVEEGLASEKQILRQLDEIRRAGQRAAELTSQLLAFSSRRALSSARLDLNAIVAEYDAVLRSLVTEHIRLESNLCPDPILILANRGQVEQVILNLVVNGRDAMPDGGVLRVETSLVLLDDEYACRHAEARAGMHALLAVSDTGIGMSFEILERLFEPFFTTKPQGKGTGLGLATVYGMVRQVGGHITVSSEEGRGSTFRVYWPASGGTPDPITEVAHSGNPGGTETILLCEDSTQIRELACHLLERAGYRVLAAEDGDKALALLARQTEVPDLLLTDIIMPGMNGRELAKRVVERHENLRVLFMSGYTADVIGSHDALEPGIHLLEKPFSQSALLRAVRRAIDGP